MGVLYQSPDLALPWSSSKREDRRFGVLALIVLLLTMAIGFVIQSIEVPELSKAEKKKLPDSLAKIIKERKKEPPKPIVKVEKKKEPEAKKEEKKKKPPPPKTEKEKKAREKAAKKLKEVNKELLALQEAFKPVKVDKSLAKDVKAAKADKKLIMGNAKNVKGLGAVAAVSTGSDIGALSERAATQIGSASLGDTTVDGSGSVGAAAAARAPVAGQRSEEQIRAVLDSSKGALYAIYNRELRKDPTLQGRVTFEITIEPDGSVSACKIFSSQLNNPALERKLVSRMRLINFGSEDVDTTKTRWAIDFLPY